MRNQDVEARLASLQVVVGTLLVIGSVPRIGVTDVSTDKVSYFGHALEGEDLKVSVYLLPDEAKGDLLPDNFHVYHARNIRSIDAAVPADATTGATPPTTPPAAPSPGAPPQDNPPAPASTTPLEDDPAPPVTPAPTSQPQSGQEASAPSSASQPTDIAQAKSAVEPVAEEAAAANESPYLDLPPLAGRPEVGHRVKLRVAMPPLYPAGLEGTVRGHRGDYAKVLFDGTEYGHDEVPVLWEHHLGDAEKPAVTE